MGHAAALARFAVSAAFLWVRASAFLLFEVLAAASTFDASSRGFFASSGRRLPRRSLMAAWVVGPAAAPLIPLRVFGMILPERQRKIRGRDHSAQLVELCFLSVVVEEFMSGGESSC